MDTEKENKIIFKMFVGCRINSELRMYLNYSKDWKQVSILSPENRLIEVHYQNKDYIGVYLPSDKITLEELKTFEKAVTINLKGYLPENATFPSVCIFPQVFVS